MVQSEKQSFVRPAGQQFRGSYRAWPPLLAGALLLLISVALGKSITPAGMASVWAPISSIEIEQRRLDIALPVPRGRFVIEQGFVPRRDGLEAVELILARQGSDETGGGRLELALLDDGDHIIVERSFDNASLSHNQTLTLHFPAQRSAGRGYTLRIGGNETNAVTVWGYTLDTYGGGKLRVRAAPLSPNIPQTAAQELRFVTHARLTWVGMRDAVGSMLYRHAGLMALALLFLPLPGCLLLLAGPRAWQQWDPLALWGLAVAAGAAIWPVLWFGLSLLGGRFSSWLLWILIAGGWLATGVLHRRRRRLCQNVASQTRQPATESSGWQPIHLLTIAVVSLGIVLRLLAVRDLAVPPWVDGSRHALITAVMVEQGTVPAGYEPYLAVERFPYHFGFHSLSASLQLLSNAPLATLLLVLGQLLNGLVPLTAYAGAWLLSRRRRVGLLVSFLIALPFFFPAYYATWGRLTQLTAMLVFPPLLGLTWLLVGGGPRRPRVWPLVGVLAAGLFLIHFRVFLFYLPYVLIVWIIHRGRNSRELAAAALLALIVTGPRMWQLVAQTELDSVFQATIPDYNAFPVNYLATGWETELAWLAGACLVGVLVAALLRRAWARLPLVLAAWVALLFLLLAGKRLGLPESNLINLNSMVISLFVPQAIFLALVADQVWRWIGRRHRKWTWPVNLLAGASLAAMLIFGVRQQIGIINPQTVLTQPADLAAVDWISEQLPGTAVFAINSWRWLGSTWAGSDGGAWTTPLTGRRTTTPPVDYIYNRSLFQQTTAYNQAASSITDWSDPAAVEWLSGQGITHIFVGARGGFMDPAALARNPALNQVYGREGVFIFEVNDSILSYEPHRSVIGIAPGSSARRCLS